tara:strand:+ start:138 stop:374 length:237 start_codon:yes stop_codon:yes gene_type:complete
MAKGLQDYSVGESVAPYVKAVVSTQAAMDPCRAIYISAGASHVLTVDDVDITFAGMIPGTIYPICASKSNLATVIFLY